MASAAMATVAPQLEKKHVHDVYDQVAHHFQYSRHRAWPKVRQFLQDLDPGAIVADIGCGNGRYLHINPNIFKLGCDFCAPLVDIAKSRKHEVLVCDNLQLPFRDGAFDAVISVAVVHHFTSKERRIQALRELSRVLRVGGRMLVYVWAMEQKHRKFESQDVLVPWIPPVPKKKKDKTKPKDTNSSVSEEDSSTETDVSYQTATTLSNKMSTHEDLQTAVSSNLHTKHQVSKNGASDSSSGDEVKSDETVRKFDTTKTDKSSIVNESEGKNIDGPTAKGTNVALNMSLLDKYDLKEERITTLTHHKPISNNRNSQESNSLKVRFLALLGQKPKTRPAPLIKTETRGKDKAYQNLLHKIMLQESQSLPSRPVLEHSLSAPESDGFAVREFPQSSQPRFTKHISIDNGNTADIPAPSQENLSTEDNSICYNYNDTLAGSVGANDDLSTLLLTGSAHCNDPDLMNSNISHKCMDGLPLKSNKSFSGDKCGVAQLGKDETQVNIDHYDENSTGAHGTKFSGTDLIASEKVMCKNLKSPVHKFCKSQSESDNESWKQVTAQVIEKLENEISNLSFPEHPPRRCLRHKKKLNRICNVSNKKYLDYSNSFSSEEGGSDLECQCEGQGYMPEHWESSNGEFSNGNGDLPYTNGHHYSENVNKEEPNKSTLSMSVKNPVQPKESEISNSTCMRYYHVFKEGELIHLIEKYVDTLEVVESCYDHANWCVVAEKCDVWTI